MTNEIIISAARNNAEWCNAVCSTHSDQGSFHQHYWLTRHGAPEFYPDFITLADAAHTHSQIDALLWLIRQTPGRIIFVKDSFDCLDLQALGFASLFRADWLMTTASAITRLPDSKNVQWTPITDEADLARWERAWRPSAAPGTPATFRPPLLRLPEIQFVCGLIDDAVVADGVLASAAGVTAISNVFATGIARETVLHGLARIAENQYPGQPLVGYASGENLTAADKVGFNRTGHLQVWHRPATAE